MNSLSAPSHFMYHAKVDTIFELRNTLLLNFLTFCMNFKPVLVLHSSSDTLNILIIRCILFVFENYFRLNALISGRNTKQQHSFIIVLLTCLSASYQAQCFFLSLFLQAGNCTIHQCATHYD